MNYFGLLLGASFKDQGVLRRKRGGGGELSNLSTYFSCLCGWCCQRHKEVSVGFFCGMALVNSSNFTWLTNLRYVLQFFKEGLVSEIYFCLIELF
jgi:hypothetical protein